MKLASYRDGSRDGQLVVVSRDLASAHYASGIATRLQQVLDDWNFLSPQLQDLAATLNDGKARHAFAFDAGRCLAPLPRAYRWVRAASAASGDGHGDGDGDGSGGDDSEYGAGDLLHGAHDSVRAVGDAPLTIAAGVAVVTGDVPPFIDAAAAIDAVRLVLLFSDARSAGPSARRAGPWASAFSPVAATPDALGNDWRGGRLALPIEAVRDGRRVEPATEAGGGRRGSHVGDVVARLAAAGGLGAGALVGAATQVVLDDVRGGSTVRFEAFGADRASAFGAIELRVVAAR